MNPESREKLLALCAELEDALKTARPCANTPELANIERICIGMKRHSAYLTEKANRFAHLAQLYFSARGHHKHPGGAEALMQEMRYRLLDNMREQIERLGQEAGP